MQFAKPVAKNELEKILLDSVENDTPNEIKDSPLINLNNKSAFSFTLRKKHLEAFNLATGSLGINDWFKNYKKEAMVSTAGIRGLQNPLYPWDTRYPLNLIGVMLATMGKILVAQDSGSAQEKIAACEVRYNSTQYVELIARLQAGSGIKTYVTDNYMPIPIFLISFLIFMHDMYGGEYVTSSHAISKKIATKDLNTQGSQYIPDESMKFVSKVQMILDEVNQKGEYTFNFSSDVDQLIDREFLEKIENGVNLYVDYLKNGVANETNLQYIRKGKNKIVIECMGGSIYKTLYPIVQKLGIGDRFDYLHKEEDPFFHRIGKVIDENQHFFDWSCDTTIMKANPLTKSIAVPVVDTARYGELLKDYPLGTVLLMTDPDADRLVTAYIDQVGNKPKLEKMGLVHGKLDDDRILVVFTPNQSFLLTIDFQYRTLVEAGLWEKYNWFLMKTTASQRSWDEWATAHNIPVINTPVGFKELADPMQQIEKKMTANPGQDIYLKDVYGVNHNLGKNPRLLFAGEESGGEIFGPAELIRSLGGRQAISMREKSAGEAIIITSALSAYLESKGLTAADYLEQIFEENQIKSRFEIRIDQKYYNESEPDIATLLKAKEHGMQIKTQNNSYFLSLALGYRDDIVTLDQVKNILTEAFPKLNFSDLQDIKFVGDGTYFLFSNKCLEVRPSGTDAVNKAYSYGLDQWDSIKYSQAISAYEGVRNPLHLKLIPQDFYDKVEDYAFSLYMDYKQNQ
jgi:phosphomannomutase